MGSNYGTGARCARRGGLNADATMVNCHSEKEHAAKTRKRTASAITRCCAPGRHRRNVGRHSTASPITSLSSNGADALADQAAVLPTMSAVREGVFGKLRSRLAALSVPATRVRSVAAPTL